MLTELPEPLILHSLQQTLVFCTTVTDCWDLETKKGASNHPIMKLPAVMLVVASTRCSSCVVEGSTAPDMKTCLATPEHELADVFSVVMNCVCVFVHDCKLDE